MSDEIPHNQQLSLAREDEETEKLFDILEPAAPEVPVAPVAPVAVVAVAPATPDVVAPSAEEIGVPMGDDDLQEPFVVKTPPPGEDKGPEEEQSEQSDDSEETDESEESTEDEDEDDDDEDEDSDIQSDSSGPPRKRHKKTKKTKKFKPENEVFKRVPKKMGDVWIERKIQCKACLRSALHGNSSGRCYEGSKKRCLRCFSGSSSKTCTPIDPMLYILSVELTRAMEAGAKESRILRLRAGIRCLQEFGSQVVSDIAESLGPVSPLVITEPRVLPKLTITKRPPFRLSMPPIEPVLPAPVAVAVPAAVAPLAPVATAIPAAVAGPVYESRKERFLDAVEPLVGEALMAPMGRYLDKYMK